MAGETVLLTGATGFIASHILGILLDHGYYVIGTVRSLERAQWLVDAYKSRQDRFKLVTVEDIAKEGAFDEVIKNHKEITYVLHTASPFYHPSEDVENKILKPAIHGTTNILKAIKAYGPQVKHVVVTSSFAAITKPTRMSNPEDKYTEKSWNPFTYDEATKDPKITYTASKKLAEEVLWTFIEENKPNFTATTVNPPLVIGPLIQPLKSADQLNTSNKFVYQWLKSSPGENTDNSLKSLEVDVREVALAHVIALEKETAKGQRWFVVAGYMSPNAGLQILNKNFPDLKIAHAPAGYDLAADAANWAKYDNSQTNEQSGLKYHTLEQTIVDTAKSILEQEKNWN